MKILMPCKTRTEPLRTAGEILEKRGHKCTLYRYDGAEKLRRALQNTRFDAVLSAESVVLAALTQSPVPKVYLASEFFCADRHIPSACARVLIAQEELAFDMITHGARDHSVRACGVPLRESYRTRLTRSVGCRALGMDAEQPIFSLFADGVSLNELKATVRTIHALSPGTRALILTGDTQRCKTLRSVFAANDDVFILETRDNIPLSLAAADAVFTPAFAPMVCAAARQEKITILLHTAVPRARRNAAFLDAHGVAFCGKTAADNVSYACRLLDSQRLQGNMRAAQEKFILSDPETTLQNNLEEFAEK